MGYKSALEAAGVQVLLFEEFGSYQGSWWAKIIRDDQIGWIYGSFGSCCVCDPFEAAMEGFYLRWNEEECRYIEAPEEERQAALAEFGRGYLSHIQTTEEAKAWAERTLADDPWEDDENAARFILEHA